MLKGQELIRKIIELDGLPIEDVMAQCGCAEGDLLLDGDFYLSLSKYAESYVTALSDLRKNQLAHGRDISRDLLLQRLEGRQLLARIEEIDEFFESGPPWSQKKKIVIKCGYVRLTEDSEIQVEYNCFHDAYTQAVEQEILSDVERDCGLNDGDPLRFDNSKLRIVKPDSDEPIDREACRLVRLGQCINESMLDGPLHAIRIEYIGCGDDGEICNLVYLFSGPPPVDDSLQSSAKSIALPESISFDGKSLSRGEYEGLIEDYSFSITYNCHGSWFNQYGGSGFLFIDIGSSTLFGCHHQNEDPEGFPGYRSSFASPYFYSIKNV